jgi:hypothetical protein
MYKVAIAIVLVGGYAVFVTFQPLFVALFNGLHAAGF